MDALELVDSSTALVFSGKNTEGVLVAPALDRALSSLTANVQEAMASLYSLHRWLLHREFSVKLLIDLKTKFRSVCENVRLQVLHSAYRHATDFASSTQRAPDDRLMSIKRCSLSAKAVQYGAEEIVKEFEAIVIDFKKECASLKNNQSTSASLSESEHLVTGLCSSLEGVQSSMRDIAAFWRYHVSYLADRNNEQTNVPAPEHDDGSFDMWTIYQVAILQASSSILELADALSVDPS